MSRKRQWLVGVMVLALIAIAYVHAQMDIASSAIQFDLRMIGESLYEARAKNGVWPARIEDLSATAYLALPHRKAMLENGVFVVVWHENLAPNPEANGQRVLAYDNKSLLPRFGRVWVCRGDLRVEYVEAEELQRLLKINRE